MRLYLGGDPDFFALDLALLFEYLVQSVADLILVVLHLRTVYVPALTSSNANGSLVKCVNSTCNCICQMTRHGDWVM